MCVCVFVLCCEGVCLCLTNASVVGPLHCISSLDTISLVHFINLPHRCSRTLQILPQKGTILPQGKQRITVEFVPHTVQKYTNHNLVLDIPKVCDVCDALLSVSSM